jgi:hypothetical protein
MKHVPLMSNMSRGGSMSGGGFGQLLNETDEEGTECVIDDHGDNVGNNDDSCQDDQYQPPMCGQVFLSKVIHHNSKKTKKLRSVLSSKRKPLFYLRKSNTKNSLGYHETFSMEQPPDSESESSTSRTSSRKHRDKVILPDRQEDTPPFIVQFDPNELNKIQIEKNMENSKTEQSARVGNIDNNKNSQPLHRKTNGKSGRALSHSNFCHIVLPTVTEEKSFDLDDKSASVEQDQSTSNDNTNLLPSVSSTSSSSGSSFFGTVNSTEEESRDDGETKVAASNRKSIPTSQIRTDSDFNHETEHHQPTSPEMMQILTAMRQIIIKQQDAIQAISDENVEFRNQLALCHRDMKTMKTECAEQLVQITQLVIQKELLETETSILKTELDGLRNEIIALKSDDVDLVNRFESLMVDDDDDDDDTDTKSDNGHAISDDPYHIEEETRSSSPINVTINKIVDDETWRQMVSSFDSSIDGHKSPQKVNPTTKENIPLEAGKKVHTKQSTSVEEASLSAIGNSFSSYGSATADIPALGTNSGGTTCSTTPERKSDDVAEFKNRLGEIQKKRMTRMGSSAQMSRKSPTVRFA